MLTFENFVKIIEKFGAQLSDWCKIYIRINKITLLFVTSLIASSSLNYFTT